jgi:hypothetical protein
MESKMNEERSRFGFILIPSTLRTIQPFLEDAQKFIRNAYKNKDGPNSSKYMKVSLSCINYAFKLNSILNPEINAEDRACLEEFNHMRSTLQKELASNNRDAIFKDIGIVEAELPSYHTHQVEELGTHELLIAEVSHAVFISIFHF